MKKNAAAFIMILCVCCHAAVFSQSIDTKKIAEGLGNFTSELIKTAPSAVSHQNMWPDAYIGQLISVPPHLGGGVSAGAAALNFSGMKDALNAIDSTGSLGSALPETLFLPTLTVDFRMGGILIPFDIGVHGMIIPSDVSFGKFSVNYNTFGGDIRFPIIKQNVVLPNLSLGAGFAYSAGNISVTEKSSSYCSAEIEAGYKACIFQASLQLSKEFLFVTPFVGVRGTITGAKQNYTAAYSYNISTSNKEIEKRNDDDWNWENYTAQLYAGIGLDILFIGQITINASYDVLNEIWAGGLSLRIKL